VHLVEKLFILSENFWFKFIPDEDCPNTDPEGIILDPTPDQAKSFGSDTVTKELNSFLIGHVERSKIHPLLSEEEVCLQSWEVPHQSEVLQVRFLWREVCYSQVKNCKIILKIESVAITDSSFGSQNLVFLYFMLWIQIRNQSHHVDNLDPHPDPHRKIKIYTQDPDSHNFFRYRSKMKGIRACFSTLRDWSFLILIRIRIRISVKSKSESGSGFRSTKGW